MIDPNIFLMLGERVDDVETQVNNQINAWKREYQPKIAAVIM